MGAPRAGGARGRGGDRERDPVRRVDSPRSAPRSRSRNRSGADEEGVVAIETLASLLPIILIAVLFYLLLVRPQTKRQKEMARMQSALEVGDRVVLTAGIHGTVTAVADGTVDVEVAPGVVLTAARQAIGQTLSDHDSLPPEETPDSEETPDQPEGSEEPGPDRRGAD